MTTTVPYSVDRAILGTKTFSAVVDINGVFNPKTGGFYVVQDAIDAGHKSIFIRVGTYPGFQVNDSGLFIQGESKSDTIIDGAVASHAIEILSGNQFTTIKNLLAKTTGGGGTAFNAIEDNGGGQSVFEDIRVPDSDGVGIDAATVAVQMFCYRCYIDGCDGTGISTAPNGFVSSCYIASCGGSGIITGSVGDNSVMTGNWITENGAYGIDINVNAENCVVVGNRLTGNSSGEINDSSGTSTVVGNDTT